VTQRARSGPHSMVGPLAHSFLLKREFTSPFRLPHELSGGEGLAEFTTITGLQPGAIVRVSGAPASSVTDIEAPADPECKFRARLEVTEDLHQLVRADSASVDSSKPAINRHFKARHF
jgi:hypothetical protein